MEAEDIAGELELSFEGSAKGARFAKIYGPGHQKTGLKAVPGLYSNGPGPWRYQLYLVLHPRQVEPYTVHQGILRRQQICW